MNKVFLTGHMGADAELRHTQNGTAVAKFRLAENKIVDKEKVTRWHNIVCWKRNAEIIDQYTGKGSKVAIFGELDYREWEDKDGNKRVTTEIVAAPYSGVELLDRKSQSNGQTHSEPAPPAPSDKDKAGDDDLPF
jgi:single-strand DNA-binding protein